MTNYQKKFKILLPQTPLKLTFIVSLLLNIPLNFAKAVELPELLLSLLGHHTLQRWTQGWGGGGGRQEAEAVHFLEKLKEAEAEAVKGRLPPPNKH